MKYQGCLTQGRPFRVPSLPSLRQYVAADQCLAAAHPFHALNGATRAKCWLQNSFWRSIFRAQSMWVVFSPSHVARRLPECRIRKTVWVSNFKRWYHLTLLKWFASRRVASATTVANAAKAGQNVAARDGHASHRLREIKCV